MFKQSLRLCLKVIVVCILSVYILKIKLQQHIVRVAQLANHSIYKYKA